MGMCGGIGASLGLNASHKRFILAYHGGRLLSYTLLGIVLGIVLPLLGIHAHMPRWSAALRWFSAIIIILTGIFMLLPATPLRRLERYGYKLWQPIAKLTRAFIPVRSHSDGFILGLLWGLLPCGLIYSALGLAISSANPFTAALIMLCFGIGTLPSMLSVTFFSAMVIKPLTSDTGKTTLALTIITLGSWSAWQALHIT